MTTKKLQRALTAENILNKKFKVLELSQPFKDAFAEPESTGVWFVYGDSTNGKTAFIMQLLKELSRHGKVIYNSLEEGASKPIQDAYKLYGMSTTKGKSLLVSEPMEDLSQRLQKHKSADFVIIDSWQYTGWTFNQYLEFKNKHSNKLLIFTSHAKGKQPLGATANRIKFDASLKIFIEGFTATSQGRYIGKNGGKYTIWEEGSSEYHGQNNN